MPRAPLPTAAFSVLFYGIADRPMNITNQPWNIRLLAATWLLCLAATASPLLAGTQESGAEWKVEPSDKWKPVDQTDSQVRAGTALDFSFLVESGEAGQHGFSFINEKGELSFEKQLDLAPRYFCATQLPSTEDNLDLESIDNLAEQIRRAGYNCVRAHYLDQMLMWNSPEDLFFNPKMVDRWDRYTAALKKRGIYLCVDAATSWSAFTKLKSWDPKSYNVRMQSRLYYDEQMRAHWSRGVRMLFEHVNPYTGLALKDEPQVVAVALRNESGLQFLMSVRNHADPDLVHPFRDWLKKKYSTTEALQSAWPQLKDGETIDTVALPPPDGKGADTRDLELFYTDIERATYLWGVGVLREIGVKVPVYDYNIEGAIQSSIVRDVLPLVDNHAYHDHPSGPWLKAGQKITGENVLANRIAPFRWISQTRQWGRPFICTEWGFPAWNSLRHEGGITMPAYAAFQGWQMLTQHSSPIADPGSLSPAKIQPFLIAPDPAAKATERMTAFLFARGDVKPSPHKVEVSLDASTIFQSLATQESLSSEITNLSLLAGLGICVKNGPHAAARAPYSPDLTMMPNGTEEVITVGGGAQQAVDLKGGNDTAQMVALMRKNGILDPRNLTDVRKGIYQSDTGEILLDGLKFSVNTPRSQALCLAEGEADGKVGDLEVSNFGAPLTIMLSSLTQDPINQSRHLLLILSGDALNNGMTFKDGNALELVEIGGPPVLARVLKVRLRVQHSSPKGWKAWALAQNGTRREEIPLVMKDDSLEATLDTGNLQGGPTPYFELEQN